MQEFNSTNFSFSIESHYPCHITEHIPELSAANSPYPTLQCNCRFANSTHILPPHQNITFFATLTIRLIQKIIANM
jgi:hypothetical protein